MDRTEANVEENRKSPLLPEDNLGSFQIKNQWIATLCSFCIHLVLLLVFAVLTFSGGGSGEGSGELYGGPMGNSDGMDIDSNAGEMAGDDASQLLAPSLGEVVSSSELSTSLQLPNMSSEVVPNAGMSSSELATISDSLKLASSMGGSGTSGFVGTSLKLRGTGGLGNGRGGAGSGLGATPQSERAVQLALAYIVAHQRNNGSWSMAMHVCNDACSDGIHELDSHDIAATGLALLCLMGSGHTMHQGEYSENVARGVYYLTQNLKMKTNGSSYWLSEVAESQMYEHGIAALALCEAYQMTEDPALREPCQNVVNYICSAQHSKGGWRYHPGMPGDLSVAAWQIMTLKSAASAKLGVPLDVLRRADGFVRDSCVNGYLYLYTPENRQPTDSMTSIGNLIRLFRGTSPSDGGIQRAWEHIANAGPSRDDVYYNYYATQLMFHMGGKHWQSWNNVMRESLIESQVKEGHMAGSWYVDHRFSFQGGRFYVTTMCCLTLQVYYRYLPVYANAPEEFQL